MTTLQAYVEKPLRRLIPSEYAALWVLAGSAGASLLIYALFFVLPFNLLTLYHHPLWDLRAISQRWPWARWWLLGGFGLQASFYWLGWRAAQRTNERSAWVIVLGGALLFGLTLLWMYPFGAADLFDNIMHGRTLGVYGANPFFTPPNTFAHDPFLPYAAWKRTPSAYGPLWEMLAGGLAWQAGNGILTNIIVFKLLSALFLAGNIGMVATILRSYAPERALAGVVLLAWNPVILYETLGNGHNDIAMIFWVLVAAWLLLKRRYTLSMLAILVGALFKFMPILMLPAAGLIALRDLPDWPARVRFIAITALCALLLVGLAYAPFWAGPATLSIGRRQQLFTTSLPSVIYGLLSPQWEETLGVPISWGAAGLVLGFALLQGFFAWRNRSWLSFSEAAFFNLMFYLLVTCLWFQSWYAVWPLALAALLPPGHAARWGALFGFAVLTKPLIFEPHWLWIKPLPPKAWREVRLGPAVLALPWLYGLWIVWQARFGRPARETR
jgi:hypothetical protein